MKKNPTELYGMEYWQGRMLSCDGSEIYRGQDNGNFYNTALFVREVLKQTGGKSALEVGCGIGFPIRHLRNLGIKADGIEYGKWAVEHSVCSAQWGDLTDTLPVPDGSHDLVFCVGVLSHIDEDGVPHALKELHRVSTDCLWTNIQLIDHPTQAHHLTFRPPDWWRERFKAAGWVEREDFRALMEKHGLNRSSWQWSAVWQKYVPAYTISIVAHNNLALTKRCIEAVRAHSEDYELIVTDNASTDGTREYLAGLENVRVIRNEANLGFILPHNRAFKAGRGKFHVVLNNDVLVPRGWLQAMKAEFDRDPKLALCGVKGACCTLGPDGVGHGGNRLDYIEASCMMARSELIRKHGLFAEDMRFGYFEDSDLSFRLKSLGYGIAQVAIPIKHEGSATAKLVRKTINLDAFKEHNRRILLSRWGHVIGYASRTGIRRAGPAIWVRRWSGIGDVILTTAVVAALRKKYPEAYIVFESAFPDIYWGNPDVDAAGTGPTGGNFREQYNLDLAYELDSQKHIVQAYAEHMKVEVPDWTPRMYVQPQARPAVDVDLPKDGHPIAVMNTGSVAGWVGRQWPPARFERVAQDLRSRGWFVVLVGNEHTPGIGVDLDYRKRPWAHTVAVIERCNLFVGVDSAPFHVAQAFRRPIVALFGSIHPQYRVIPTNPLVVGLQTRNLTCIGCHHRAPPGSTFTNVCAAGRGRTGGVEPCMDLITVGDVMAAVDRVAEV